MKSRWIALPIRCFKSRTMVAGRLWSERAEQSQWMQTGDGVFPIYFTGETAHLSVAYETQVSRRSAGCIVVTFCNRFGEEKVRPPLFQVINASMIVRSHFGGIWKR